jgi:phenylpropionate dioxygenase-like ring-hydroxylating dioxygenase large terminal subunit
MAVVSTDEKITLLAGHWYVIASSHEVRNKPVALERFGERLVLWRQLSGQIIGMTDQCAHRGAQLSGGKVMGDTIVCPFHGFAYDAKGQCTLMPCEESWDIPTGFKVQTHTLSELGGWVWLWRGPEADNLPSPPVEPLVEGLAYGELSNDWDAHYTRAIEVQIDYAHLPFVHKKSIGRFMQGKAFDVGTELDTGRIKSWLNNNKKGRQQWAAIRYPNVWVNSVGGQFYIQAVFIPVTEKSCHVIMRFHHPFKIPLIKQLVSWFGTQLGRKVIKEDRPVVQGQLPVNSDDADEKLTPADAGIVGYRKLRRSHQTQLKLYLKDQ